MAKMIQCKTCGADIAANAKTCPHCGARNKKPIFKRWWFWAVCVVVVIAIIAGGESGNSRSAGNDSSGASSVSNAASNPASSPASTPEPTKSPEEARAEYIDSCEYVAYSDIARNPDQYQSRHVTFNGTVVQVSEGSGNSVVYRIATAGAYDDVIYVTYTRKEGESRILEDDFITIYGDCDGVTSYESVLGGTITIPSVKMKYFTIN